MHQRNVIVHHGIVFCIKDQIHNAIYLGFEVGSMVGEA